MSKIWFTSDTHFSHRNIIQYSKRPFTSIDQMDAAMIQNWNDTVKPEDTVYFLGDFSLAKEPVENVVKLLNGTKHLVMGNHDRPHIAWSRKPEKAERFKQWYLDMGFASVQYELTINIDGNSVKLHHMPYLGDHTDMERYAQYRPKDEGGWLLHGHIHNLWKVKGRMINVGVDVWDFKPVSEQQIAEIIKNGGI